MEIIGVIEQILDKSNPQFKKKVAIIKAQIINGKKVDTSKEDKNKIGVEFRNHLAEIAKALRSGDFVKVKTYSDCKIDNYSNFYNNVIAEKVDRL